MSQIANSFKKIGLVCGFGKDPIKIATLLSKTGVSVFIVKLHGEADNIYSGFDQVEFKIGQIEKISKYFLDKGCTDIVLSGKIRNQSFLKMAPDFSALQILSQSGKLGDNFLLTAVSDFFAKKGFNVIPQDKISPREFLPAGYMFGKKPEGRIAEDIQIAISYLAKSSEFDIGQSLIIQSGRFIALEGCEGTDAMIERVIGLVNPDNSPAIFLKMAKLNQSLELDLPVFGLGTIKRLCSSNIKIACLQAEYCKLSVSLSEIESVLIETGISLYAVDYET